MVTERKNPEGIRAALAQCNGSEHYYPQGLLPGFKYTDGVKMMADMCGAYWLIDVVASYQVESKVRREHFQVWTLTVREIAGRRSATVTCKSDSGMPDIVKQEIEYTDFPLLGDFVMWCIDGIVILPSEY